MGSSKRGAVAGALKSLSLCLGYTCNSRCSFCIVSGERDRLSGRWLKSSAVSRILNWAARERGYKRLVVTGGEVTLYPGLPGLLREAKGLGFTMQVQTNGRRLADAAFSRALVEAGADEFFIPLHGDGPALHDGLTRVPGSYRQTLSGIAAVLDCGGKVVSNTVIVAANFRRLAAIAGKLARAGIKESHFWFITPTGDARKDPQIPKVSLAAPYLRRALGVCEKHGVRATVKYFPACLLGAFADRLDNTQTYDMVASGTLLSKLRAGWAFSCPHERTCSRFAACGGLTGDYVRAHGTSEVFPI
jgi:MoaA/NifB/PqqE/SkfB family radical SAM enzyme